VTDIFARPKQIWVLWTDVSIKIPSIIFYVNSTSGSRDNTCGQTDRWTYEHDKANCFFARLCESAQKQQNALLIRRPLELFLINILHVSNQEGVPSNRMRSNEESTYTTKTVVFINVQIVFLLD
jgi:hypothetical protein